MIADPMTATLLVGIPIEICPRPDGGYLAASLFMPGCTAEGDDLESVLARIRIAADLWIDAAIDRRDAARQTAGQAAP